MTSRRRHSAWIAELERRDVFRVSAVYGAIAFVVLETLRLSKGGTGLPPALIDLLAIVALLGYPVALFLAWRFDLSGQGVERTPRATSDDLAERVDRSRLRRWAPIPLGVVGVILLVTAAWQVLADATFPF
ncbi:MAG: hypothetical protein R6X22_04510 [Gemmatimonadota bacterium]